MFYVVLLAFLTVFLSCGANAAIALEPAMIPVAAKDEFMIVEFPAGERLVVPADFFTQFLLSAH